MLRPCSVPSARSHPPRAGAILGLLLAVVAGCTTTRTERPAVPVAILRVSSPEHVFEVVHGQAERVGFVVRFEGDGPGRVHYMVRNIWHQDLGLIDHLGRAYRYVPHRPEPLWVGTGTVEEGVEEILGLDDCLLFELPLELPGGTPETAAEEKHEAGGGSTSPKSAPFADS